MIGLEAFSTAPLIACVITLMVIACFYYSAKRKDKQKMNKIESLLNHFIDMAVQGYGWAA